MIARGGMIIKRKSSVDGRMRDEWEVGGGCRVEQEQELDERCIIGFDDVGSLSPQGQGCHPRAKGALFFV